MPLLSHALVFQPFIILASLFTFLRQRTRLLPALLALESIALLLVFMIINLLGPTTQMNMFLILIILSFSAMEASLGLALMVALSRAQGSDMTTTLTPYKC